MFFKQRDQAKKCFLPGINSYMYYAVCHYYCNGSTWENHWRKCTYSLSTMLQCNKHAGTLTPTYSTCIIPLGKWSMMFCKSSTRRGLFGLASMAASRAWAVNSSLGTVTLAFFSPPLAGEEDRDRDFCCLSVSCWLLEAWPGGTSSDEGLWGWDVSSALGSTDTGTAGRLLRLLTSAAAGGGGCVLVGELFWGDNGWTAFIHLHSCLHSYLTVTCTIF